MSMAQRPKAMRLLVLELCLAQVFLKVQRPANTHDIEFPSIPFFIGRCEYSLSQEQVNPI